MHCNRKVVNIFSYVRISDLSYDKFIKYVDWLQNREFLKISMMTN